MNLLNLNENNMKRILIICLMSMFMLALNATEREFIVVYMVDGTTIEVPLQEMPIVKIADGKLKITTAMNILEIERDNVSRFTFSGNVDGVGTVLLSGVEMEQDGNILIFRNLPKDSDIAFYSVEGVLLDSKIVEGEYVMSLEKYPKGIYIVRVNGIGTKIVKTK